MVGGGADLSPVVEERMKVQRCSHKMGAHNQHNNLNSFMEAFHHHNVLTTKKKYTIPQPTGVITKKKKTARRNAVTGFESQIKFGDPKVVSLKLK